MAEGGKEKDQQNEEETHEDAVGNEEESVAFENMMKGGGEMEDMSDFECSPCLEDGDSKLEIEVQMQLADAKKLCLICKDKCRKTRQIFCEDCEPDVRGARRDANRRSTKDKKAFARLQRLGSDAFVEAVLTYKASCRGHGRGHRRDSFAWGRYLLCVEMKSVVRKGSRSLWLKEKAYVTFVMGECYDINEADARADFRAHLKNLPVGRISDCKTMILWPMSKFVETVEEKSHGEQIQLGVGKEFALFSL